MSGARQIYLATKLYAGDHNGHFPSRVGTTSNESLAILLKEYMRSKEPSIDPYSPFTPRRLPSDDPQPDKLLPGQNAWAYIPGLTDNDRLNPPLLSSAFILGSVGEFDLTPRKPAWRDGRHLLPAKALPAYPVIVYLDGSAKFERPTQTPTGYRIIKETTNRTQADIFAPAPGWLTEEQRPQNPAL